MPDSNEHVEIRRSEQMKKRVVLVVAAFVLSGLWTMNISAQEAGAKPKVVGEQQAVLESWNDIGRKLIAMAEDFPEDKYDYKPTPAQRSFAEQLLQPAGANYFFSD